MHWFKTPEASNAPYQKLGKGGLLADLTKRELKIVHGFIHERDYLANEVIFDQGEDGQALYFILHGEVLICLQGRRDEPLARLDQGGFFGEMALIDNSPRSAQAIAGSECRLALLFRGDFERLMQSHAQIATKIAMQLARHLGQRMRGMLSGRQTPVEADH